MWISMELRIFLVLAILIGRYRKSHDLTFFGFGMKSTAIFFQSNSTSTSNAATIISNIFSKRPLLFYSYFSGVV